MAQQDSVLKSKDNNKELNGSIDRSLDDFGRFLRNRGLLILIVAGLAFWLWISTSASTKLIALQFAIQIVFAVMFIIIQFVALFWFLGRPRVYWVMPGETGVSFADYKGNPEVLESARRIVTLMRGVKGFKEMGGEVSKGLLLVGPPGTGKSYLAQCISTEAGVPFCYASAASFKAMFIGMDVLMIKGLYGKARRLAREYGGCIIFMDEFDAIGTARSSSSPTLGMGGGGFMGMGGTGSLNELLMQMDPPPMDNAWWKKLLRGLGLIRGRMQDQPVFTMAATNIPESLDPALLRPGRFDRKIAIVAPSDENRGEVIEYYFNRIKHEDIPLNKLVADFRGYTPVAIKYVLNEAAVIAHFSGRSLVSYKDINEAREAHEQGLRYPRKLSMLEKRRLAYHEAGHAVAIAKLMPRHRISHVTISKRLGAGGAEAYAAYKEMEEIVTNSAEEIFADIQVSVASRAAEELFLQTRLNGVGGDLVGATRLALLYVTAYGMNDTFFSAGVFHDTDRLFSDPEIRTEAEEVIRRAYTEVRALLEQHREAVIALAEELIVREDIDGDEAMEIIRKAGLPKMDDFALAALQKVPPSNGQASIPAPSRLVRLPLPERVIDSQVSFQSRRPDQQGEETH